MRTVLLLTLALGCRPGIDDSPVESTEEPVDTGTPEDTGDEPIPDPPVAVACLPETAWVDQKVLMDGSASSDPGGFDLLSWQWSCSDGTEAQGERAQASFSAPGEVSCTLTVDSETGLSAQDQASITVLEDTGEEVEWTVLVYLSGDNNLEENALEDLNELESAPGSDQVRVVVQLDRSPHYTSADDNWSGARRYLVVPDDDPHHIGSPVLQDLGKVDSGDPEVLADFLTWGISTYPARHYAVVFWDHGYAWERSASDTKGFSIDESAGTEISVARGELRQILEAASTQAGARLDLVGFDACMMGSWEIAHDVAPYANVFVASQATEGLDGWDWTGAITELHTQPTLTDLELGQVFVSTYPNDADRDATLSVVDIGALADFEASLDALATATLEADMARQVVRDGSSALDFEWGWGQDRDLGQWLAIVEADTHLTEDIRIAAGLAAEDYAITVYESWSRRDYEGATGMSIYLPDSRPRPLYYDGSWADDTLWDEVVQVAYE